MKQRILITVSIIFLSFQIVFGQGSVQDTRIEVIKNREIKLKVLNKGFDQIPTIKPINQGQELAYELKNTDAKADPTQIKVDVPQLASDDKKNDLWESKPLKVFVKGGYGNYQTSLFEAQIQHQLNDLISYGLYAQHRASGVGEVADNFSALSRNVFGGYFKYFLDRSVASVDVSYRRQVNRFYGYDVAQLENFDRDTLRQRYNRLGIDLRYQSIDNRSDFYYDFGVKIVSLQDAFDVTEGQIGTEIETTYRFSDVSRVGLFAEGYFMQREDGEKLDRGYIRMMPNYTYKGDKFGLLVGANLVYQNDTLGEDKRNFHLYPVLRADYLISGQLQAYLDVRGTMQRNTLDGFVAENPFLGRQALLFNTNQLWKVELGAEGTLIDRLSYQLYGSLGSFENLAFFVNTPTDSARFGLAYEREASNVINVGARLEYQFSEQYQLQIKADIFSFDVEQLEEAWHRPTFTANLVGIFKPIDKLDLRLDLAVLGGIKAKNFTTDVQNDLNTIADLSLQADYSFFQNFSAFLSANNLFSNSYQRYLYYPNQGINFLIGLKYAF